MPPRRVNANRVNEASNPSEGDKISTIDKRPHRANVLEGGMDPLVQAMIRAFQQAVGANTPPMNRGLPLERLPPLGGREFNGV